MIAEGMSESEVLDAYPDMEIEDIREALRYAAEAVRERSLPLTSSRLPRDHWCRRHGSRRRQ